MASALWKALFWAAVSSQDEPQHELFVHDGLSRQPAAVRPTAPRGDLLAAASFDGETNSGHFGTLWRECIETAVFVDLDDARQRRTIASLGKSVGPPLGKDQKDASLAAMIALH